MGRAVIWTAQRDQTIRDMRAGRASWDAVAAALGLSRDAVLRRGAALGLDTRHAAVIPPEPRGTRQRPPLPPNDPLALQELARDSPHWRAIVGQDD